MLKDKVVLVSGALGTLGKVFSEAIVRNQGKVILLDVIDSPSFVHQLGEDNCIFVKTDVTSLKAMDRALEVGLKKFGKIDGAIHSAYPRSKQWGTKFEDLQAEFLYKDLSDQLGGAILFSQKVSKIFIKQGYGNLIHISSIQGVSSPKFEHYEGSSMVSPIEYSCIKSGVIALSQYLAKYFKGKNIRVNCVSPGGILADQPESFRSRYKDSCLSKGMLDASDINGAIIFLLSDDSKFISGQNLIVDDGWVL